MIKSTFLKAPLVKNNISPIVYHIDGANYDIERRFLYVQKRNRKIDNMDTALNLVDLWEHSSDKAYGDDE